MGFSSLSLTPALVTTLTELGYQTPTDIQRLAIPEILDGVDLMAKAQTGTGKTAAFALPILQMLCAAERDTHPIRALILTPTRELAQQVYQSFVAYGKNSPLKTAVAYGGVSIKNQVDTLKKGVDILVATPGRLLDHLINGSANLAQLEYLVFDEADRMLDLGFKDEIDRLLRRMPDKRQTMLFSATFDDAIFKLAKKLMQDPKLVEVEPGNAAAADVEQIVYAVDKARKRELTSHLIGARNWHQVLIFVRTKQGADSLAKQMNLDGIETDTIHGDKSQGARDKALAQFKEGKIRALIATDVASRGIDIRQLQYVINYELPHNAEDYIHRIGRTGRAGESGLAITLMSFDEAPLLEAVEKVQDKRLTAQWLPGYEPDLDALPDSGRPKDKSKHKRQQRRGRGRKRS